MRLIRTYTKRSKTHYLRYSSGKILGLWVSTFHTMLAEVIWIGVLVWPDSCGDVKIPYPFCIIEGCYLKDTAGRDFFWVEVVEVFLSTVTTRPVKLNQRLEMSSLQTFQSKVRFTSRRITGLTVSTSQVSLWQATNQQHSGFLVSQFLSLKTSSWLLVVILTHTLMVIWTMNPSPSAACPNVKTNTM